MKIRSIFSKALSPKPAATADAPAHKKQQPGALAEPPSYEIVETAQLGEGGYGKVFEATVNGDVNQRVAIKKIALGRVREESLLREVRIGRELNHPNIVRVHDSYTLGSDFHMVMELVKGGELFERVISLGVMAEQEAANHFGQLLLAVHHCHSKGVAHRDIKLENILLQPNGQVKLIDFGLAALHDVVNGRPVPRVLKDKCGSKSYAAPEVNTGRGYNGFGADVWSCGICLFAMLAGFFPLDEAKETDWRFRRFLRAEAAGQPICAAIFGFYGRTCPFSEDAVALIEGMLRANPFERLRVDELLASPWLRRNAAPRVRALIEVTLNPLPLGMAHADRLDELLRPHSAPNTARATAVAAAASAVSPRQPLTPPAQPTQANTLQSNLERAYAALSAVVRPSAAAAAQAAPATAEPTPQPPVDALATSARFRFGGGGRPAAAAAAAAVLYGGGDEHTHAPLPPPPDSRKRRPQRASAVNPADDMSDAPSPMSADTETTAAAIAAAVEPHGNAHCLPAEGAYDRRPIYRSLCVSRAALDAMLAAEARGDDDEAANAALPGLAARPSYRVAASPTTVAACAGGGAQLSAGAAGAADALGTRLEALALSQQRSYEEHACGLAAAHAHRLRQPSRCSPSAGMPSLKRQRGCGGSEGAC